MNQPNDKPQSDTVLVSRSFLEATPCPNCDGSGFFVSTGPDPEQEQCQWCFEKHLILSGAPRATPSTAAEDRPLKWLTADEVTEPGNYIREDSEELCVVEMAKQRVLAFKPYYQDALACQGSFHRPDWGDAKFYGPISLQALLKDRASIVAMMGLLAKARRERDEAKAKAGVASAGADRSLIAERAECAKAMCPHCREGKFPEHQSDPVPTYWHDATRCRASEIWTRGQPSDVLGLYIEARSTGSEIKR